MSQANVDLVRRVNALANAGDWDAVFELYHPDIEFRDLQHAPDLPEVFRGIEEGRLVAEKWTEAFDEFAAEIYEYVDAHPWVVCDTRWQGKGKGSDLLIDGRAADAYEVSDGKVVRAILGYADMATALKAVGYEEWAMSANVDLVRSIYAGWGRGDFSGLEWAHPEIEYVNPPGAIEPGTRRGLAAFRRAIASVFDGWETWHIEPQKLEAFADQVAVVVRYRGRGRGSGAEVTGLESALWTVRDGKVVRYEWFHEPADASSAARPTS